MARVLFLSLTFPPDGVSTAQLMGELAADLHYAGHTVAVLTTTPHYNRDRTAETRQPMRWRLWPLLKRSELHGVPIHHVRMPRKGRNLVFRGLAWAVFHVLSLVFGVPLARRAEVIIVPSPPLTLGLVGWLLGLVGGGKYVYNVQEIYPDVAVNLGVVRNKALIRSLERLERFVYAKAYAVTVISPAMRQRLCEKGVPSHKLRLIPNWVDLKELVPVDKNNEFAREYGLQDRFVVSYAGNVGPTQPLDVLIEAADRLRQHSEIHFLIVGGGTAYQALHDKAAERNLPNITFLAYQPYAGMPLIYGASDLCVVPQVGVISSDAIPSKVYRILACGRPVLGLARPESDLSQLVIAADAGIIVDEVDVDTLAEQIMLAAQEPERWSEAGRRGRTYVLERYGRPNVTSMYEALVREAAG